MSKINQSNKRNTTSTRAFSLGNRGTESIFSEIWNPNDSKVIFFFPDCNFTTYFFFRESQNVHKILQTFSSSPIISIGFIASNDIINFLILCCHQGVAAIDASINIGNFLKSISSSTIISVNSDKHLDQLNNFYRIKINAKEIDSMDGYIKYIQSDRLGPNSKQILNHEISDHQQTFTILDVVSICYRTVAAYHYFTTFCDRDKTAPLPMVHPTKTVQQNEQVKTIPLKLIPPSSSTSPPSHSQINEYQKSISNNQKDSNPNLLTQKKSEDNKNIISITTLIPNFNANRPQSPPVLPKNFIPSQAAIQSRAQSPPQVNYPAQSLFHHSQSSSPINSNLSANDMTKYFQQLKEKSALEAQQQNSPQQQTPQKQNQQHQQNPSPQQKNQSKSPPAQFNPQQIVSENRTKQRQQHVGSPPTQNYQSLNRNGWHSLTSDPSFSDSTMPGSGNSAPEATQDNSDQITAGQEIVAQAPNQQQQNQNNQWQKQQQRPQQNNQRNYQQSYNNNQKKQQSKQNQQQQRQQQKQQQQNQQPNQNYQNQQNSGQNQPMWKQKNGGAATDWKPVPKSRSPPNSTLFTPDMITQKPQTKSPPYDQRIKCPICSILFEKESLALNHFITQHGFMKDFDKAFRYTKDGLTCLVCHKTMKCYDFVISHAIFFHYQLFEDLILSINDSDSVKNFLLLFKNKVPVLVNHRRREVSENQIQDARSLKNVSVQTDTPEDLFDDSYCNFIASSINTEGIATEKIELSKFEPIEIEMIQENLELFEVPVDAHFWKQLDMLEALMKGTDKAIFEDERFFCKICNVKCKSNATLLQHCFEQHRDLLDSFD